MANKKQPSIQEKVKRSRGRFLNEIHINQFAVISNKWELDIVDMAVFQSIYISITCRQLSRIVDHENMIWYEIPEQSIIDDLPLCPINTASAVEKRIAKLVSYKLLERCPDNRVNGKKHIRLGSNAEKVFDTDDITEN